MLTPCVLLQHHLRKAPGVAVQHRDGTSPPRSNSTATTPALGNGDSSDGCLPPAAALCHRLSGWEKPNKAPGCVHPDPCSPTTREAQTLSHGLQSICEPVPASSGCSLAPQDCLAASTCHASNHTGVPCWPWHRRAQRQQNRPSEGEGISQVLQKCHMKRPKNGSDGKKQTIPAAECFRSSAKKLKFAQVKVGG